MEPGKWIEQSARLLWRHKSLAALGILDVILTSSGLMAQAVGGLFGQLLSGIPELRSALPSWYTPPPPLVQIGQLGQLYRAVSPYGTPGWVGVIGGSLIFLIALAVVGIVIEGGIMAAVARADEQPPSVKDVFSAGWRRALPMVVIASIPAIPLTLGAILVVIVTTTSIQGVGGVNALASDSALAQQMLGQITLTGLAITCLPGLVTLPLLLLSVMAYRACMIEALDAVASLRRAWHVLRANLIPALLLVAISYGVSVLANIAAYLPNALTFVFLPAIVIVWAIHGMARAYYLILWTLGWQTWTVKTEIPMLQTAQGEG